MSQIEKIILRNLIKNEPYTRKVLPYLKNDIFQERSHKFLFDDALNIPDLAHIFWRNDGNGDA